MLTTIQLKLVPDESCRIKIDEMMKRDTRIINRVLNILQYEEENIYSQSKSGKWKTSHIKLARTFLATKKYPNPPHDMKKEFWNISHNELVECINSASRLYLSYMAHRMNPNGTIQPPRVGKIISRRIFQRRFTINQEHNLLETMYSCETNLVIAKGIQSRVLHDKLKIPYIPNKVAKTHLLRGEVKFMTISQEEGRYYVLINVEIPTPVYNPPPGNLGVIGVDLGIAKTATAVLYSQGNIISKKILNDPASKQNIEEINKKIANLQGIYARRDSARYRRYFHLMTSKISSLPSPISGQLSQSLLSLNSHLQTNTVSRHMINPIIEMTTKCLHDSKYNDRLIRILKELREVVTDNCLDKTENISRSIRKLRVQRADIKQNMVRQLCADLQKFIEKYMQEYNLYVAIGRPNGIRKRYQKGSSSRSIRKKINTWAFAKFQTQLKHNLKKIGLEHRVLEVNESWTSKICFRCNRKGVRSQQEAFHCSNYHCKIKINADLNGAINIAKRAIVQEKLVPILKYPQWYISKKHENRVRNY